MSELIIALEAVTRGVVEDQDEAELPQLDDNTNLFEILDSLSVVNLLLETESQLEQLTGNYVSIADQTIFDAEKSPLLKWSSWIEYVELRIDN